MLYPFPDPLTDSNIGSCIDFYYIPVIHVDDLIVNTLYNYVSSIQLKSGMQFFRGYASQNSLEFSEKIENNNAGLFFSTKISGFYPRLSPDALNLFCVMKDMDFLVIVTDGNNHNRMCGTLDTPMLFSFDQTSGKTASSRNGFKFSFEAQLRDQSPFYNISI